MSHPQGCRNVEEVQDELNVQEHNNKKRMALFPIDHPIDQSPPVPKDEVDHLPDHLQPRLAATKVQLDNLEDLYVTSTRL